MDFYYIFWNSRILIRFLHLASAHLAYKIHETNPTLLRMYMYIIT